MIKKGTGAKVSISQSTSSNARIKPVNDWKFDREPPSYPQYIEVTQFGDDYTSFISVGNDGPLTSSAIYRSAPKPVRVKAVKKVEIVDTTPKNRKFYLDE
jgi:hypothetical protein